MRTHVSKLATTTFAALLVAAAGVGASAQKEDRAGAPPEEVKKARRDEPIVERKVAGPQPAPTGPGVEPASGDGTPRPAPTEFDKLAPETRLEKRTEAIRLRLDEPITMSFPNETPLEDVLRYIRSVTQSEERDLPTGIPIYVDPISLQEAEKTLQSPVSLDLEGIPLSRSLHLTLRQLGLTYFVEGGLLVIYCHSSEIRPEDFRSKPPMPDKPSPLEELKQRAERGELDAAQRKDLIQTLRDLKEIDALLHDPYYGKPADHPDNKPGKPSIP